LEPRCFSHRKSAIFFRVKEISGLTEASIDRIGGTMPFQATILSIESVVKIVFVLDVLQVSLVDQRYEICLDWLSKHLNQVIFPNWVGVSEIAYPEPPP
jgi:hypothetical protein